MYLYLDLILLLNFFIDLLLLWMTAHFRKVEVSKGRFVLAAGVGSLFVLCFFIPSLQSYYTFLGKVIISVFMVWLAFGFGHFQKFLSTFAMFYFVSFVTGGGMLAIHYLLQSNHQLVQGILVTHSAGFGDKVAWWFVLLGFPIMYWFSGSRWGQIEVTKTRLNHLVSVLIYMKGKTVFCTGLIDTGNQLFEPITNTPVMIVEAGLLQSILPKSLYATLVQVQDDILWDTSYLEKVLGHDAEWLSMFRLIPYRGVGQQMKLMLALKPELVEIRDIEHTYVSKKVLLGLNQEALSTGGEYQAIVHPTLLRAEYRTENFQNRSDVNHVHQN